MVYALCAHMYKQENERPLWVKSRYYYTMNAIMITVGGIFVVIYLASGSSLNPFLEMHVGASAPFIIKQVIRAAPNIEAD